MDEIDIMKLKSLKIVVEGMNEKWSIPVFDGTRLVLVKVIVLF